jgi:hypothetical protein
MIESSSVKVWEQDKKLSGRVSIATRFVSNFDSNAAASVLFNKQSQTTVVSASRPVSESYYYYQVEDQVHSPDDPPDSSCSRDGGCQGGREASSNGNSRFYRG